MCCTYHGGVGVGGGGGGVDVLTGHGHGSAVEWCGRCGGGAAAGGGLVAPADTAALHTAALQQSRTESLQPRTALGQSTNSQDWRGQTVQ